MEPEPAPVPQAVAEAQREPFLPAEAAGVEPAPVRQAAPAKVGPAPVLPVVLAVVLAVMIAVVPAVVIAAAQAEPASDRQAAPAEEPRSPAEAKPAAKAASEAEPPPPARAFTPGGVGCGLGSGSVGPFRRPLSNTMVTGAGGGSISSRSSCRIVTSRSTPITIWISSDSAPEIPIRQRRRGREVPRRTGAIRSAAQRPLAPHRGSYRFRSRNTPCSPNRLAMRRKRRRGARRPASSAASQRSTT